MGERSRLVTFRRGRATYGIDVRHVRKVLRSPPPQPLPSAPDFVCGGITVDDRLEVLVDVAVFFGDAEAEGAGDRAVLVSLDGREFALRADGAGEVTDLDETRLQPLPPFLGAARRSALRGVVTAGREQVLVVDLARLLELPELEALDAAGRPAPGAGGAPDR